MPICDIVKNELIPLRIEWQSRSHLSVSELARERITTYFREAPTYNSKSIYVHYQIELSARSWFDRLLGINEIYEEFVFEGARPGELIISPWYGRCAPPFAKIDTYLAGAECAMLSFRFGTHPHGACVLEWNTGSTRIGIPHYVQRDSH